MRTWVAFQGHVERSALQWHFSWCVLLSWSSCKTTLNTQGLKLGPQERVHAAVLEFSAGLCCPRRVIAELYCKYAVRAGTMKIEVKTHNNGSGSPARVSWLCIGFPGFDWSYHKGDTDDWKVTFWTANTSRRGHQKGFKKVCKIKEVLLFFVCHLNSFSHFLVTWVFWVFTEHFWKTFLYFAMSWWNASSRTKASFSPFPFI